MMNEGEGRLVIVIGFLGRPMCGTVDWPHSIHR